MSYRIGIGYDIHRLVEGRRLILGGVEIPFEKGLLGHSDGDALFHAVSDAMLGALAMGDIGQHFPDTDPAYKGADSAALLKRVFEMVTEKGWKPANVDVNIIAEKPRLASHIGQMRESLSGLLLFPADFVSIKARTNETLDAVGRSEAIAVQAAVLLQKSDR